MGKISKARARQRTADAVRHMLAAGAAGAVVAFILVWSLKGYKSFSDLLINSDVAGAAIGVMLSVGTTVWITSLRDKREWRGAVEQSLIHIRSMLDVLELAESASASTAGEVTAQVQAASKRLKAATIDDSITDTFLRAANSRALMKYFDVRKELLWGLGILEGTHEPHANIPPLSSVVSTLADDLQEVADDYRARRR
jgi:hypothetical protein